MLAFDVIGSVLEHFFTHCLTVRINEERASSVSVEFIGMIQQQKVLETHLARGPAIDIDYLLRDFAQAHEKAGFDRILVPYQSTSFDAMLTPSPTRLASRSTSTSCSRIAPASSRQPWPHGSSLHLIS